MKRLALALVLCAPVAFAQEIGTEIAPPPPPPSAPSENPHLQPSAKPPAEPPQVSAGSGAFGLRAGFGASGGVLASGAGVGLSAVAFAPLVGASLFVSNAFKLNFELGFGLALANGNSSWAAGVGVGAEYLFRSRTDALRPLLFVSASFGISAVGSSDPALSFGVQAGGGAEYFFSPNFSLSGRLGLSLPVSLPNGNLVLGLSTLAPALGATFYL
jgi:hypothetical protein